jgi:hypothetical protein
MKTMNIKPTVAFANGKRMEATSINVVSVSDNLYDHVIFKYTLFDALGQWAGESTFELEGRETYAKWDASAENAYEIVIHGVGLEIQPEA